MPERLTIQINDHDNVAVAVHDLPAGTKLEGGLVTRDPIPQAHKIALRDIPAGGEIVRYGVVLGYAKADIPAGSWINEHMLDLPESPAPTDMPWGTRIKAAEELPAPTRTTWLGYRNKVGPAGTRNLLGIVTTVQCAAGVLKVAVERIKKELLPKYPHVDGVVAVTHPYGCGVAINAPLAYLSIRAVSNLIRHPNFGGEIMVVGLGCEKLTYDRVLPPEDITPENVLTLRDYAGHDAMMQAILDMADRKLQRLDRRRREELPLSELLIGMQCGGSDAFSGITANPSAGYAADMLVRGGATVLFSEVTEVRDGVHMLAARCVSAEVRDKLAAEMKWYDDYLAAGGVDRDANPTPGNKKGGLANIVEKAMSSIAKSGTSPIVEVLSPAEKPAKHGLIFAATPASDIVCGPSQLASGIGLQVFMTGRGTPYGLDVAPVIKVCSRTEMKEHWFDLIDISAGLLAACGGSGTSTTAALSAAVSTEPADGEVSLSMSWWGGESRHEAYQKAIAAFMEEHGNITVNPTFSAWTRWEDTMSTKFAGGVAEDVCQINWNWMYKYSGQGQVFTDLREYSDYIDFFQWDQSAIDLCFVADSQQAVPTSMTGRIFYWNMTTFRKAGLEDYPSPALLTPRPPGPLTPSWRKPMPRSWLSASSAPIHCSRTISSSPPAPASTSRCSIRWTTTTRPAATWSSCCLTVCRPPAILFDENAIGQEGESHNENWFYWSRHHGQAHGKKSAQSWIYGFAGQQPQPGSHPGAGGRRRPGCEPG